MSQLDVVDPVPKPVPFAQYVCAFSSVLLFCWEAFVDVDVAIDAVAWVATMIIYHKTRTFDMHVQTYQQTRTTEKAISAAEQLRQSSAV